MRMRWLAAASMLLWCWMPTRDAQAGVLFFVNDAPGFAAATVAHVLIGSEDWSSAGAAPQAAVADPLQPGVAKGPFPNGVAAATGMTVQSNTLGSAGTSVAPGGNLFYAPTGLVGVSGNVQASNQLSANMNNHGFDLIFDGAGVERPDALSLSPMFYRTTGGIDSGTITVKAFGAGGASLGTTTVANVVDVSEAAFLGVVATPPDTIGRVNLWAGATAVAGADNIDVYSAPEPGALAAGAVALVGIGVAMPRRSALGIGHRERRGRRRDAIE